MSKMLFRLERRVKIEVRRIRRGRPHFSGRSLISYFIDVSRIFRHCGQALHCISVSRAIIASALSAFHRIPRCFSRRVIVLHIDSVEQLPTSHPF